MDEEREERNVPKVIPAHSVMSATPTRAPVARMASRNGEEVLALHKSGHISSFLKREVEESRPSSPAVFTAQEASLEGTLESD